MTGTRSRGRAMPSQIRMMPDRGYGAAFCAPHKSQVEAICI